MPWRGHGYQFEHRHPHRPASPRAPVKIVTATFRCRTSPTKAHHHVAPPPATGPPETAGPRRSQIGDQRSRPHQIGQTKLPPPYRACPTTIAPHPALPHLGRDPTLPPSLPRRVATQPPVSYWALPGSGDGSAPWSLEGATRGEGGISPLSWSGRSRPHCQQFHRVNPIGRGLVPTTESTVVVGQGRLLYALARHAHTPETRPVHLRPCALHFPGWVHAETCQYEFTSSRHRVPCRPRTRRIT